MTSVASIVADKRGAMAANDNTETDLGLFQVRVPQFRSEVEDIVAQKYGVRLPPGAICTNEGQRFRVV